MIDGGASDFFVKESFPLRNQGVSNTQIKLPDGSIMQSSGQGQIKFTFSEELATAQKFATLQRNLVSHNQFFDANLLVCYDFDKQAAKGQVYGIDKMTGRRTNLGRIEGNGLSYLDNNLIEPPTAYVEQVEAGEANLTTELKSTKQRALYAYRCLLSPPLNNLAEAVNKGWVKLPYGLTMRQVRDTISDNDRVKLLGTMRSKNTKTAAAKSPRTQIGKSEQEDKIESWTASEFKGTRRKRDWRGRRPIHHCSSLSSNP